MKITLKKLCMLAVVVTTCVLSSNNLVAKSVLLDYQTVKELLPESIQNTYNQACWNGAFSNISENPFHTPGRTKINQKLAATEHLKCVQFTASKHEDPRAACRCEIPDDADDELLGSIALELFGFVTENFAPPAPSDDSGSPKKDLGGFRGGGGNLAY